MFQKEKLNSSYDLASLFYEELACFTLTTFPLQESFVVALAKGFGCNVFNVRYYTDVLCYNIHLNLIIIIKLVNLI